MLAKETSETDTEQAASKHLASGLELAIYSVATQTSVDLGKLGTKVRYPLKQKRKKDAKHF